jgi:diguanylate cyclase (GGDEF)-like protein
MNYADPDFVASTPTADLHALEADLQLARALQQALLPQQYPSFPASVSPEESALRFYHRYQAATALSGDFYSVQQISDSSAGIFICDVMGHGVRPAMFTAMLRSLIEELSPLAADPGQFLSNINIRLINLLQRAQMTFFATAFYMVIDAATGEMKHANAGHPAPMHMQRSRGHVLPLAQAHAASGPALGVFEEAEYPVSECAVSASDVLLLFTDGLVEAKGCEPQGLNKEYSKEFGEEFGEARLQAALHRHSQMPTPCLLDQLVHEQQQFCGTRELEDDVCLLAIEVCKIGEIIPTVRDDATGLYNRRYLQESLAREVHRAQRNGYPLGVVILALEDFENWSKTDQDMSTLLLREVGELLRHRTRGSDIACHSNTGNFILVLPEASLENSARKAEQLLEAIQQIGSKLSSQNPGPIVISKGVAAFPENGATAEAVIEAASARAC